MTLYPGLDEAALDSVLATFLCPWPKLPLAKNVGVGSTAIYLAV